MLHDDDVEERASAIAPFLEDGDRSTNERNERVPTLSRPLQVLFATNGLTLALPMASLLYIINVRVGIPLNLLPSYAAVAFLPSSLKPLYAYVSTKLLQRYPRHGQITMLLTFSAFSYAATTLIPKNAIAIAFLMALLRGILDAWPEFLLGLTLIDQALNIDTQQPQQQVHSDLLHYNEVVALFQSQAATARNLGTLVAHIMVGLIFVYFGVRHIDDLLNDTTVAILLYLTAGINVLGSLVAWQWKVGSVNGEYRMPTEDAPSYLGEIPPNQPCEDGHHLRDPLILTNESSKKDSSSYHEEEIVNYTKSEYQKIGLVINLQMLVVLLILRKPIEHVTSKAIWTVLFTISVALLLGITYSEAFSSKAETGKYQCRIGLFLILRNSLPSVTYVMSSYFFAVFEKMPLILQFLSLVDMGISIVACWLYGKLFRTFNNRQQLVRLIAGTTMFAAIACQGNAFLVRMLHNPSNFLSSSIFLKVTAVCAIRCVTGLAGQWNFLPDLILATTSIESRAVSNQSAYTIIASDSLVSVIECNDENDYFKESSTETCSPATHREQSGSESCGTKITTRVSLEYGTFISCIDIGGQVGALMVGPILNWIGTSRENDWKHLDWLLELNSLWILLSLFYLFLLR